MKIWGMPYETQRVLEWFHFVLTIFCTSTFVIGWVTSPRLVDDGSFFTIAAMVSFLLLPLVVVTSVMLLFVDSRRGVAGLVAFVVSLVSLFNSSVYMV